MDSTRVTDAIQSGPCISCGAENYPLSMGGPSLCPMCDCSPPSMRQIREMREGYIKRITTLQTALRQITEAGRKLANTRTHIPSCKFSGCTCGAVSLFQEAFENYGRAERTAELLVKE